jgi:hypothetical protein
MMNKATQREPAISQTLSRRMQDTWRVQRLYAVLIVEVSAVDRQYHRKVYAYEGNVSGR